MDISQCGFKKVAIRPLVLADQTDDFRKCEIRLVRIHGLIHVRLGLIHVFKERLRAI